MSIFHINSTHQFYFFFSHLKKNKKNKKNKKKKKKKKKKPQKKTPQHITLKYRWLINSFLLCSSQFKISLDLCVIARLVFQIQWDTDRRPTAIFLYASTLQFKMGVTFSLTKGAVSYSIPITLDFIYIVRAIIINNNVL